MTAKAAAFSAEKCNVPLLQKDGAPKNVDSMIKLNEQSSEDKKLNQSQANNKEILEKLDTIIEENRILKKRIDGLEALIIENNQSIETKRLNSNNPNEVAKKNAASLTILLAALREIAKEKQSTSAITESNQSINQIAKSINHNQITESINYNQITE